MPPENACITDKLNESCCAVLSHGAVYYALQGEPGFRVGKSPRV